MKELEGNNIKYYGLTTRDYLILKHISLNKELTLLEIGIGTGSFVDKINGKVKKYYGVDIACDVIDYLAYLYRDNNSLKWRCLDACHKNSSLNESFDIIFSSHTLEHVESPRGYFDFIKRHLKINGTSLVIFPNESKEKHHGITWFENKKELLKIIEGTNLQVVKFLEIKETFWHKIIKKLLWQFPKSIILRNKSNPQTFEKTQAFKIMQSSSIKSRFFSFYAKVITKIIVIFKPYKYFNVGDNIVNKNLFIQLKHK